MAAHRGAVGGDAVGATTVSKIAVFGEFENCVITDRLRMAVEFWSAPTAGRRVYPTEAEYLAAEAKRDERRRRWMAALDDRYAADR